MPVSVPVGGGPLEHVEVRRGEYHDSVTLMLAGRAVAGVADIERVLVAMATELNVALLAELGYAALPDAGPADLIIAFTCPGEPAETAALNALADSLSPAAAPVPGGSITAPGHPHPDQPISRTTGTALGRTSAPITLISTPGLASIAEAMESLEYGASPIIFSDNIPIHHEARLKEAARRRGLLVMGPDCGTVVLHGTGLGFANVTRPGPISLVAASGTGAQELMALLDAADTGIRHCLGVGGRDLSEQVAGRSTLAALTALADDAETELIVVVSKPPHPDIATRIKAHAATLTKPVHFAFVGPDHPTLTESAERILTALGQRVPGAWPSWAPSANKGASRSAGSGASTSASAAVALSTAGALAPSAATSTSTTMAMTMTTTVGTEDTTRSPDRAATPAQPAATPAQPAVAPRLEAPTSQPSGGRAPTIRGLFSGGTLRSEADAVLTRARALMLDNQKSGGWGRGESEKPQNPADDPDPQDSADEPSSRGRATDPSPHSPAAAPNPAAITFDLTDFGDDAYTRGRPHPMIDNTLRLRALADAAEDPGVGVLLLDVVLGRGAHADPGSEVAAAVGGVLARRPEVAVVVSLCGTAGDPQGLVRQAELLAGAGAWVFLSNAEAAEAAARLAWYGLPRDCH